ncbi:MAG: gamma-butyrobetaine hydroxylase-like domain-containing protein [Woeseiaceae bacterium]
MSASPVEIRLRKKSRLVAVTFDDGSTFDLPFEYLRVFSPSAEVKGHGPGQGELQTGKENVRITKIEPIGHYAVRLVFDDGHDTGLYTWNYLYELGDKQPENWQAYLDRLEAAGYARRDPAQE